MLTISQSDGNYIVIGNIKVLSKNDEKKLFSFLQLDSNIFQNVKRTENEISFSTESLNKSLNQLEKYLQKQNINDFEFDKNISNFKKQLKNDEKKLNDLRKIGSNLKIGQNISEEFELEYNEFKKFCEVSFPQNHIPYENQIKSAFFHLKMEKSCNFSAPGTGKTTIVYTLFSWLKNKRNEVDAIFIIGPVSSLLSWKHEYQECFGRTPSSTDFNLKTFRRELNIANPHNTKDIIYFLNYEKVKSCKKELINFFKKWKILLVLDEAHRIKNPKSQRTNYLSEIINNNEVDISYQIILTGTPIPNGYENLYSYFDLTKRDELPILSKSYEELKKIKNDDENEIDEVFQQVAPFFYSLRKKDMGNFKEPDYIKIYCQMENFQSKLFNTIRQRLFEYWIHDADQKINLEFYRSKIIRLLQIQTDIRMILRPVNDIILQLNDSNSDDFLEEANNKLKETLEKKSFDADMKELKLSINTSEIKNAIEKYNKEGKIPDKYIELLSKVKELIKHNEKVVIWSSWIYCIKEISILLNKEGIDYGLLYGGVSYDKREEYIETFNKNSRELMVLVANPASVGESISLHKVCQNAIYFDINYNVTNHFQSKDRIHRVGMPEGKEQVTYYYLLSKDSMEENVLNHIQKKEQAMNNFLDKNNNLFNFKDSDFNNFMPNIEDIKETLKEEKQ